MSESAPTAITPPPTPKLDPAKTAYGENENGTAPPASAGQIARLQASVDALGKKLEAVHRAVDPEVGNDEPSTPQEKRKAQWIAAGAVGLLTGKVVSLFTAHAGVWFEARKSIPVGDRTIKRIWTEMFDGAKATHSLTAAFNWGMVGLAAGFVPGAILGYVRGERIKNTRMYWKEPVQSIKILLGFEKGEAPKGKAAIAGDTHSSTPIAGTSGAVHDSHASAESPEPVSTEWRDRTEKKHSAAQPEASLQAANGR